jgi:hypothetical protein
MGKKEKREERKKLCVTKIKINYQQIFSIIITWRNSQSGFFLGVLERLLWSRRASDLVPFGTVPSAVSLKKIKTF